MPKERYQVRWNVYGALAAVERYVGYGADDRVLWCWIGAFLITALTMCKSGATKKNFIIRLTTFNLLDLRLSLDCELHIRIY